MPKGPGVVIVARHGARLDAADKSWHLTSPAPYDPPLTYGGWTQSKALGIRIASLLHARRLDAENEAKNADLAHLDFSQLDASKGGKQPVADGQHKGKRHRIVIHTSPYLRCIQTSTAIAAGIAQFQPSTNQQPEKPSQAGKTKNGLHTASPRSRISTATASPALQAVTGAEPPEDKTLGVSRKRHVGPDKIMMRIDAFLGEWLSPDYFEDITPPPNSTMMVAGAKADLLRKGEYVEIQHNAHTNKGHFPGGWAKSNGPSPTPSRTHTVHEHGPLAGMGSLAQVSPFRERSSSHSSVTSHSSRASHKGASSLTTAHKVPSNIYDPPVPSYAVSPADPIPRGYVSHARDACIDVDYQWDSMREPQEWGDGGEFGDEWSTMHKRFRKGLSGMMEWYKEHGAPAPQDKIHGFTYRAHAQYVTPSLISHKSDPGPYMEKTEDDEELVLILVTHGAGCNALLGAITNQPVLLDVGVASLSLAVRKQPSGAPSPALPHARRPSVMDPGMSEDYEMKMLASLDHLRPGVDPSKLPRPSSPAVVTSPTLEYRRRFGGSGGANSPVDSPLSIGQPYHGINSSLGSMRRSSTSGSSTRMLSSALTQSTSSMTGLWSGLRAPAPDALPEGGHSPGHDMVLNFGDQKPKAKLGSSTPTSTASTATTASNGAINKGENKSAERDKKEENDDVPPLPTGLGRSLSQHGLWGPKIQTSGDGLWGPPRKDGVEERALGPKRRWTVTERE